MFLVIDTRTKVVVFKTKDHNDAEDMLLTFLGDLYNELRDFFEIIEGPKE